VTLDIYGRREQARLNDQLAHVHAAPRRPLRVVVSWFSVKWNVNNGGGGVEPTGAL
jgi:hypothetical protein